MLKTFRLLMLHKNKGLETDSHVVLFQEESGEDVTGPAF